MPPQAELVGLLLDAVQRGGAGVRAAGAASALQAAVRPLARGLSRQRGQAPQGGHGRVRVGAALRVEVVVTSRAEQRAGRRQGPAARHTPPVGVGGGLPKRHCDETEGHRNGSVTLIHC